jgi:anti-sigma factor RsiW
MRMTCADVITDFVIDYLEMALPADVRADFEHHLDVCPSCVAYLNSYRQTIAVAGSAVRDVPAPDVPEELVQVILETLK